VQFAVSYLSLQLCQPMQQTSNVLTRLREYSVVFYFTSLMLQAEIEQPHS